MFAFACEEEEGYEFIDVGRIQFSNTAEDKIDDYVYSFVWLDSNHSNDTIYLPISVLGGPSNRKRFVNISQQPEYKVDYVYDNNGYAIDSLVSEVPNQAIPNKHYVAFDDPDFKKMLSVNEGNVRDLIPVILLRDESLKNQEVRLNIKLEVSDDFQLGEEKFLTMVVVFSDKLSQPKSWNYKTTNYLGSYSIPKHELMINVVGGKVDNEWIEKGNQNPSFFVFWRGKFVEALEAFNSNPDNIASGKAPLREDPSNPNSPLVKFRNTI